MKEIIFMADVAKDLASPGMIILTFVFVYVVRPVLKALGEGLAGIVRAFFRRHGAGM